MRRPLRPRRPSPVMTPDHRLQRDMLLRTLAWREGRVARLRELLRRELEARDAAEAALNDAADDMGLDYRALVDARAARIIEAQRARRRGER